MPWRPNSKNQVTRRGRKGPTKKPSEFRALQLKWYKKLRRAGFKDIEGTSDFNDFPVSTLRSSGGTTHLPWDFAKDDDYGETHLIGWDGQSGLGESSQWEYYARLAEVARSSRDPETRAVLDSFLARRSRLDKVKVPGVSKRKAMSIWTETIKALGLPQEGSHSSPPRDRSQEKPGPVKHLSKRQIRGLRYKPPKDIEG